MTENTAAKFGGHIFSPPHLMRSVQSKAGPDFSASCPACQTPQNRLFMVKRGWINQPEAKQK